jgi:ABC-type Na+ efflux pump permease subunit
VFLPFAVIVGGWLGWKRSFYGSVLPNTFWAKAASGYVPFGIYYVSMFFVAYFLLPLVVMAVAAGAERRRRAHAGSGGRAGVAWERQWCPLAVAVPVWFGYVALVGGDFMEFRLLVPILPFLMTLSVGVLFRCIHGTAARTSVLVAASPPPPCRPWGSRHLRCDGGSFPSRTCAARCWAVPATG